jgi:hypothetical protein
LFDGLVVSGFVGKSAEEDRFHRLVL